MIEFREHSTTIDTILRENFGGYQQQNDPFEKIAVYYLNGIVGLVSYSIIYDRAEINYILVVNKYRRQNIGGKLLNFALKDIFKNKCKTISLEVEEDNIPAIKLYEKYGFIKKAVRDKYYNNKNAILMVKELRWSYEYIYFSHWN